MQTHRVHSTARSGAVRIQNKHGQDEIGGYEPSWREVQRAIQKTYPSSLLQLAQQADLLTRAYGWD